MIFRLATYDDCRAIAHLHTLSWQQSYRGLLDEHYLTQQLGNDHLKRWSEKLSEPAPNQYILLAESKSNLAGFICVYGANHPVYGSYIENLHVASSYKGRGLGTALMMQATDWLNRQYGPNGMYLEVLSGNTSALSFYESLGGMQGPQAYWNAPDGNRIAEVPIRWARPQISRRA